MAAEKAAARRRYLVLGPVEACCDGRVLPVAPGKQTQLLAALLARPDQVVQVDTLVDALWGEHPPPGAAGTLRTLVSKLRRALDGGGVPADARHDDLLVAAGGGYRLRLAGRAARGGEEVLDAREFSSLLARARVARVAGQAEAAAEAYRSALGMWRGAAFAGASRGDPGASLVTGEARRLDAERAEAIEERLATELDLGRHAQLLGELEALVTAEPLRERPREMLMVALYRAGRQQDALAVYRRLRALLAEELGVEPSAAVRGLHQRLLRQDPTLDHHPSRTSTGIPVPADAPDRPLTGNLPVGVELVGREEMIAQTIRILGASRVVTLTGPGGVGKSRLAARAAGDAVRATGGDAGPGPRRFADGAWLVELAPVADGSTVADAVSAVLAVQHRPGLTVLERLVEYLRSKRLLLVLDNCEHVIEAAAELVAGVVRRCPHVVILATSREPMNVDGERVRPVPPLAVPPPSAVEVEEVERWDAAALFVARAGAAAAGFALTDANAAAVAEICRRLDGMPLALELAATRMRSMSPREVVDRLEQRFRLLRGGRRASGTRHHSLQAAIDWSYELLGEDERRAFDRLSVFAGGFTATGAWRVVTGGEASLAETAVAALLADLVDKSMVVATPEGDATRYTVLETLRAYGRERLAARGEEQAARHAHAAYLAAFVETAAAGLDGAAGRRAADAIAAELDDLRSAHAWALGHDLDVAVRIVAGLFRYVEHRMPPQVPVWAERTVEAVEAVEAGSADRHALLPTVYAVAARGAARRGDLEAARALAERGAACGGPGDPARRHPLYAMGVVALFEGRLDDAGRLTEQVQRLALAAGDAWFAVRALTIRGLAHVYAGDLAVALEAADEARALADRSGDPSAIGWSRYLTGEALLEPAPERAAIVLDQALGAARTADDRYLAGVATVSATSVRARHGDPAQAASLFRDVIEHWHGVGNWTQQWTTVRNVVELLVRAGVDEPAAVLLGALDSSGAAPPAFGAGALRLAAARRGLADRLGPEAAAAAAARGAGMGDDQTLRLARDALARVVQQAPLPR